MLLATPAAAPLLLIAVCWPTVHPVIATRWAGTLKVGQHITRVDLISVVETVGRIPQGAKKLQMIMVENEGHNPDPDYTSFSCRIPNTLRKLPESERPNLIALLKEYGEIVSGDRHISSHSAQPVLIIP